MTSAILRVAVVDNVTARNSRCLSPTLTLLEDDRHRPVPGQPADLVARPRIAELLVPNAAGAGDGDVHGADRFLRRAAARSGDARHGGAVGRAHLATRPLGH